MACVVMLSLRGHVQGYKAMGGGGNDVNIIGNISDGGGEGEWSGQWQTWRSGSLCTEVSLYAWGQCSHKFLLVREPGLGDGQAEVHPLPERTL